MFGMSLGGGGKSASGTLNTSQFSVEHQLTSVHQLFEH